MVCFSCCWEPVFFLFGLFNFLSKRLTIQRGCKGEHLKLIKRLWLLFKQPFPPTPSNSQLTSISAVVRQRHRLGFSNMKERERGVDKGFFRHQQGKKPKPPNGRLWREMVALLLERAVISCHAAGRCALGAANASIGAAVLGGGRVVGNRLSLCSWAGASWGEKNKYN